MTVTIGGPGKWQRGQVPNGSGSIHGFSDGNTELTPGPRRSAQ